MGMLYSGHGGKFTYVRVHRAELLSPHCASDGELYEVAERPLTNNEDDEAYSMPERRNTGAAR